MPDATSHFSPRSCRRGFTLIEMVIVMGIIILVLAIAVPAWDALVGNNGLAAAQNQISAALANARSDAIYNRQTIGVLFFIDPTSGQTAMAEVQPATSTSTDTNNTTTFYSLEMVYTYDPTLTPKEAPVYYRDVVLLPAGVGIALNNNNTSGGTTYTTLDRYVRFGAILFGSDGTLTSQSIGVLRTVTLPDGTSVPSQLATRLGLIADSTPYDLDSTITSPAVPLTSTVGLLLYDQNVYMNQKATGTDSEGTGDGAAFSESDLEYLLPNQTPQTNNSAYLDIDKSIEESWLDQNGIAILISPFNGSMIKAK